MILLQQKISCGQTTNVMYASFAAFPVLAEHGGKPDDRHAEPKAPPFHAWAGNCSENLC